MSGCYSGVQARIAEKNPHAGVTGLLGFFCCLMNNACLFGLKLKKTYNASTAPKKLSATLSLVHASATARFRICAWQCTLSPWIIL